MDIPTTTKLTYTKGKAGKTFTEYKLNEALEYPKLLRISEKEEKYFLSIIQGNKWVQFPLYTTEHFDFYGVSVPLQGVGNLDSLFIIYFKPSLSLIEVRIWENVNIERGNMAELNELINLIIYQF